MSSRLKIILKNICLCVYTNTQHRTYKKYVSNYTYSNTSYDFICVKLKIINILSRIQKKYESLTPHRQSTKK